MRTATRITILTALAGVLLGCALLPAKPVDLMGTVDWHAQGTLPPNAVVEVTLYDDTNGGSAAQVIATQSISLNGRSLPVAFDLVVQPGWLKAGGSYVLRAQILSRSGSVLYATGKGYPVALSKNPPEYSLVVKPVAHDSAP